MLAARSEFFLSVALLALLLGAFTALVVHLGMPLTNFRLGVIVVSAFVMLACFMAHYVCEAKGAANPAA